ncbi:MAG: ADP-ribose diphosphatase [Phenylobacterium sp.]|jgi:ADP-ribose diphosphatase
MPAKPIPEIKPRSKRGILPQILNCEVAAKSRLFTIETLQLQFSNGEKRDYERMKSSGRGSVMVIPMLDADTMLLISEYSAGTHSYELGFPKGLIDPPETPAQAGNRELMEEIGYGAHKLVELKMLSLAPGYFNAQMNVFIGFDLYAQRLEGDEPEPLEVIPWPLADIDGLLEHPDFTESRSVAALLLAQKWLTQAALD